MEFAPQNLGFIEALYAQFLEDPTSVEEPWRKLFEPIAAADGHLPLGPRFRARSIFNPVGLAVGPRPAPAPAGVPVYGGSVEQRIPFLRSLAIFQGLADEELVEAAKIAAELTVADGEVFVREGDMGQDLYVITDGTVLIRRGGRVIAELTRGEVVGEMAVLDHRPRSADALAHGSVNLLRIHGEDLLALLEKRPVLARGIIAVLVKRLRDSSTRQDRVDQLIRAYRVRGHLMAQLDPLGLPKDVFTELNPAYYGFGQADLDMLFSVTTIPGKKVMSLRDIIAHLRKTYCRSIGVQFYHIDDLETKNWLQNRMESTQNTINLSQEQQIRILTKLTDAEIFEQFIHRKFIGAKRFSLEGAESLIPLLDMAIEKAGDLGVDEVVIGMAHRGRLNVLANVMGKNPRQIFREFDDTNPDLYLGRGDVKYHLGYSADRITTSGQKVHLSLCFNPSHLEVVDPVVVGRVRAKQDRFGDRERHRGLGILIHGDAAFAGEGVVQETLNMSRLAGYETGGTLHIVVNNQLGFTTLPEESRSSPYATDVAKMLQIPIFHVNGEHPEAVAQAIQLAAEFREHFKSDVVIDMYCYRRYGHNEGDEPAFTQPLLYKTIRKRKSVREGYLDNLLSGESCEITREQADQIAVERRQRLEDELGAARAKTEQTLRSHDRAGHLATLSRRSGRRLSRRDHRRAQAAAGGADQGDDERPQRLQPAPEDREAPGRAARDGVRRSSARLGRRRGARVRDAAERGLPRPSLGTGRAAGHVQPPARGPARLRERADARAAGPPLARSGAVRGLQQPAQRDRSARLRLRLQPRLSRRARDLGGAVRRLHERRPGHHRSVHHVG